MQPPNPTIPILVQQLGLRRFIACQDSGTALSTFSFTSSITCEVEDVNDLSAISTLNSASLQLWVDPRSCSVAVRACLLSTQRLSGRRWTASDDMVSCHLGGCHRERERAVLHWCTCCCPVKRSRPCPLRPRLAADGTDGETLPNPV